MRRYIYIFGLTVLFWGTSCADFINIQPENATTYSNYYKNEKELEAVLTGLQVYLRQAVGEFTGGDISRAGEILDYDRSSRKGLTLSNVGTWKYYYYTIYQANLILENTHRFKGDPEKLKPYIQQAYFAKAVAYFYLAMNYGQVPITGSTIEFSKFPQSPISSVLDGGKMGTEGDGFADIRGFGGYFKRIPYETVWQQGCRGCFVGSSLRVEGRRGRQERVLGEGRGVLHYAHRGEGRQLLVGCGS